MRRKIEAKGTIDFPQSQGQKLYGSLIMVITLDTRGQVISTDISKALATLCWTFMPNTLRAKRGPYGPFNESMRKEMDQLALVTRFSFDHNNTLETTLQGE
jgi:protein TonB